MSFRLLTPGFRTLQCPALGAAGMIEIGATVASTAASMVAESQQAHANAKAIEGQETLQQNEIAQQAGNAESVAAKQARAARSASIVAAGAAGISTGSNSFLASLQTTTMNASQQTQLLNESERNSESGSIAQADSELATSATSPTIFGGLTDAAMAGAGAYAGAKMMSDNGKSRVPSDNQINPGNTMAGLAYFDPNSDA